MRPMPVVLALLGALRAALRTRTDLTLENLRSGNSLLCSAVDRSDRNSGASIVSSGCGSLTIGPDGERRSNSFARGA